MLSAENILNWVEWSLKVSEACGESIRLTEQDFRFILLCGSSYFLHIWNVKVEGT